MAIRSKTHRRRLTRRSTKHGGTLAKKIKKTIHRMAEHKQNEFSSDAVPYGNLVPIAAGANTYINLVSIAQGSDNSNRIGDQVEGYVHVKGMVRNTSATNSYVSRMSVVVDTAQANSISSNTVPVQSNIFVTPTDLYSDEYQKQKRYNVIKKKVVNLGPSISGSASYNFNFRLPKRIMNWSAGTAAATDMSKGIPYILFEAEAASVLEYVFTAATYFTDM